MRETVEQVAIGSVGVAGIVLPNLAEAGDLFSDLTIIFSFFFIVVPTGIWACYRAYKTITGKQEIE